MRSQIPADRNSADIQILTSDRVAEIRCSQEERFHYPKERASEEIKCRLIVREAEIKCPDIGRRFTSLRGECERVGRPNLVDLLVLSQRDSSIGEGSLPRKRPARPSVISYLYT